MTEILTDKWLDDFFGIADDNDIIKRRETFCIEFKASFDWNIEKARSNYSKSLSAFANNKGGALFFGVENRPHKIVGIENFEDIDDADISNYINEIFTPTIRFDRRTYDFNGKMIGILYAHKSDTRPIICCKDSSKTNSSDIYYRYGAKSSKIKSGDLMKLMNQIRKEESEKWMSLFQNASKVGISNLNILNTVSGEIIGDNNTFLLDEKLLKQIKVIDRYSIQSDGEPAVKIIGEIPELTRVVAKNQSIYEEDIYVVFLTNNFKFDSIEYIKSICYKNTSIYPIYSFIQRTGKTKQEIIDFLVDFKCRSHVKDELIARIEEDKKMLSMKSKFTLKSSSKLGPLRKEYFDLIIANRDLTFDSEDSGKVFLESIFSLNKGDFDFDKLIKGLYECYNLFYPFSKSSLNYLFRDALSYIDYVENSDIE